MNVFGQIATFWGGGICPDNITNQKCPIKVLNRDSSVDIVIRIWAGRQRDRGSIPRSFKVVFQNILAVSGSSQPPI